MNNGIQKGMLEIDPFRFSTGNDIIKYVLV